MGYSPWVVPTVVGGIQCVVVDRALRDYDERAWNFVMGFARDNDPFVTEACLLPEPPHGAERRPDPESAPQRKTPP